MPDLRKVLRVALFIAVFFYFATPLVLAAGRSDRGAPASVHSCAVRKSAMLIKDVSIEIAGFQRAGEAVAARLCLNAVLAATEMLDRLGAVTVTFVDPPSGTGAGRRR